MAAAWATEPGGQKHRGAAAISAALGYSLGTQVPLRLYGLPVMGWFEDTVYWLIARLRGLLPGVVPHCVQFPGDCEKGTDQMAGPRG